MRHPKHRAGIRRRPNWPLMLIALFMLPVGVQAALFPRSFFEDFPRGPRLGCRHRRPVQRTPRARRWRPVPGADRRYDVDRMDTRRRSSPRGGVDRARCRSPRLPRRSPPTHAGRRSSRPPRVADRGGRVGRRLDDLPDGQTGTQHSRMNSGVRSTPRLHQAARHGTRRPGAGASASVASPTPRADGTRA